MKLLFLSLARLCLFRIAAIYRTLIYLFVGGHPIFLRTVRAEDLSSLPFFHTQFNSFVSSNLMENSCIITTVFTSFFSVHECTRILLHALLDSSVSILDSFLAALLLEVVASLTFLTDCARDTLGSYPFGISCVECFLASEEQRELLLPHLLANTGLSGSINYNLHFIGLCSFLFHCVFWIPSWVFFPGRPVFTVGIEISVP